MKWLQKSEGKLTYWVNYESESRSVMSTSLQPHGLYSSWNSPGQNTGVGSLSLLQGLFPAQGLNPSLPHCRRNLYQLSQKGSPRILEWIAYPFSSGSSQPRNRTRVSALQADCLPIELNWEKGFVIAQQLKSLQIFLWLLLTTSRSPSAYSKDFADYRSNCFPSWYINLWSLINSLLQYVLLLFHYHTIFGAFLLACNTHTKSSCILNILGNGFPHNKHSWGSGTQAKQ